MILNQMAQHGNFAASPSRKTLIQARSACILRAIRDYIVWSGEPLMRNLLRSARLHVGRKASSDGMARRVQQTNLPCESQLSLLKINLGISLFRGAIFKRS
jgi:hypothetical protein